MRKEGFRVVVAPNVDNKIERDLPLAKVHAGKAHLHAFSISQSKALASPCLC